MTQPQYQNQTDEVPAVATSSSVRRNDAPTTSTTATNNNNNNQDEEGNRPSFSSPSSSLKFLDELMYCFASFQAILPPVSITMILSALAVVYINTPESMEAGEEAFSSTYEVFDLEEGDSSQNFVASVGNAFIMVSVICAMTVVIVLLYKYGCIQIFFVYMVFVSAMLLAFFTSSMWLTAIDKWGWRIDKFSFTYVIWNYAVVGVAAIFSVRGIPRWMTQGYLVTSSATVAWQLSYFNEWTAWTLLIVLALYDLFAVLTPCGPLKALANLMSRPGARPLPGLLYEAQLPSTVRRPNHPSNQQQTTTANQPSQDSPPDNPQTEATETTNQEQDDAPLRNYNEQSSHMFISERLPSDERVDDGSSSLAFSTQPEVVSQPYQSNRTSPRILPNTSRNNTKTSEAEETVGAQEAIALERDQLPQEHDRGNPLPQESAVPPTTPGVAEENAAAERRQTIPLALARMYKLTVIDTEGKLRQRGQRDYPLPQTFTPEEIRAVEWNRRQLRSEITVVFPARGGWIQLSTNESTSQEKRYEAYSRSGNLLRTFVVTRQGEVMQVVKRESNPDDKPSNTIKLGLGDFIFYSILVSKAALYSFTSFATCFLVILMGLCGTLVLLAVHGKALPALPISIFLGVAVFFLTIYVLEPMVEKTFRGPLYF